MKDLNKPVQYKGVTYSSHKALIDSMGQVNYKNYVETVKKSDEVYLKEKNKK